MSQTPSPHEMIRVRGGREHNLENVDVDLLTLQVQALLDQGNTVVLAEHDMRVTTVSDWIIDLGPGAGRKGGGIVTAGTPGTIAAEKHSVTAPFLRRYSHPGSQEAG